MIKNIFSKEWLLASGVRALKTFCQTCIATIGTSAVITEVNWKVVLSASILAAILSMLTSIGGLPEVDSETNIKTATKE